jgi:hypothetical protein
MDRRSLISGAAGAFAVAVATHARADLWGVNTREFSLTDAQKKRHFIRFPELETESLMDFVGGFKRWQKEYGSPVVYARSACQPARPSCRSRNATRS